MRPSTRFIARMPAAPSRRLASRSQCGSGLAARCAERRCVLQVEADGFVALRAALGEHARDRLVQLCARLLGDAA